MHASNQCYATLRSPRHTHRRHCRDHCQRDEPRGTVLVQSNESPYSVTYLVLHN